MANDIAGNLPRVELNEEHEVTEHDQAEEQSDEDLLAQSRQMTLLHYVEKHQSLDRDLEWLYLAIKRKQTRIPDSRVGIWYLDENGHGKLWSIFYRQDKQVTQLNRTLLRMGASVRAVCLSHHHLNRIDMQMVDLMWTVFNIDVALLRDHLDVKDLSETNPKLDDISNMESRFRSDPEVKRSRIGPGNAIRAPPESTGKLIHLRLGGDCLSAQLQNNTVLVLVRNLRDDWEVDTGGKDQEFHGLAGISKTHFFRGLRSLRSLDWDSSTDPFCFLCPLINGLLMDFWTDRRMWDPNTYDVRGHPLTVVELSKQLSELITFRSNLEDFIYGVETSEGKLKLMEYVQTCKKLEQRYNATLRSLKEDNEQKQYQYQNEVLREQLIEARESKAAAKAVNRLTRLAFIFIPLSFASSVLGMNLTIFGSGTVPIWVFFVLAAVIVALALVPFLPIVRKKAVALKRTLSICRTGLFLAVYSPFAGTWFLLLYFTHGKKCCGKLRFAEGLEQFRKARTADERTRIMAQLKMDWVALREDPSFNLGNWLINHEGWIIKTDYFVELAEDGRWMETYFPKRWWKRIIARPAKSMKQGETGLG